jgi:hypothetical protein
MTSDEQRVEPTEDGPLDHVPPHLRQRVSLTAEDGTQGYLLLADLVALGYVPDPDPTATKEW